MASNNYGPTSYIVDKKNGFFFKQKDVDDLVDKVIKVIGNDQTITNSKSLWQAGFGSTQQDSRIGYMFNVLGNYNFTAAEHTVQLTVKSGTFNIASITIADHGA